MCPRPNGLLHPPLAVTTGISKDSSGGSGGDEGGGECDGGANGGGLLWLWRFWRAWRVWRLKILYRY